MIIDTKKLKSLIGIAVKNIEKYDDGNAGYNYFITFNNGLILMAQDGEYGENAFEFVNGKDYKAKDKKVL